MAPSNHDLRDTGTQQVRGLWFAKRGVLAARHDKRVETVPQHRPTCLLNRDPLLFATVTLEHPPRVNDESSTRISRRDICEKHQQSVM